jgi:hypothetical protein
MYAGLVLESGSHFGAMESAMPGRKKKRARKGVCCSDVSGETGPPSDLAGTWMRKEGGVLRQLVVSKLDATWSGPWEFCESQAGWVQSMDSLSKNLKLNELSLEKDGEFLRVV